MKNVNYCDLKKGEVYAIYKKMQEQKMMMIFTTLDSKPVMDTFSIIRVKTAWCIDNNSTGKTIRSREEYVTNLSPASEDIYILDESEINTHLVIPQL